MVVPKTARRPAPRLSGILILEWKNETWVPGVSPIISASAVGRRQSNVFEGLRCYRSIAFGLGRPTIRIDTREMEHAVHLSRRNVVRLSIIANVVVLLVAPCRLTAQSLADDLPEQIPTAAVPIGGEHVRSVRLLTIPRATLFAVAILLMMGTRIRAHQH